MSTQPKIERRKITTRTGSLTNWRCRCCGALLGRHAGHRMQITFARGHDYYVTLPVTTRCRTCKSLNELTASPLT